MTSSRTDKRLLESYQRKNTRSGASPLDIPPGEVARKLAQACAWLVAVHLVAIAALYTPNVLLDGDPFLPELQDGSSYTRVVMEQYPQFEAALEDSPDVVDWIASAFTAPPVQGIRQFVEAACPEGEVSPSVTDVVGIPVVIGYMEQPAIQLARATLGTCEMDEETLTLAQNVLAASIARIRDEMATRRVLRGISGWIQALTIVSAAWCLLMLRLRYRWANLQRRITESGELPDSESPANHWNLAEAYRSELFVKERRKRGLIILPVRLIHEVILAKAEEPTQPVRELIRSRIDSYRKAIDTGEYSTVRFLRWLAPSLGFLGTILGIVQAMAGAPGIVESTDPTVQADAIRQVSLALGTAFDTTFVALLVGIPMTFLYYETWKLEMATLSFLEDKATLELPRQLDNLHKADRRPARKPEEVEEVA